MPHATIHRATTCSKRAMLLTMHCATTRLRCISVECASIAIYGDPCQFLWLPKRASQTSKLPEVCSLWKSHPVPMVGYPGRFSGLQVTRRTAIYPDPGEFLWLPWWGSWPSRLITRTIAIYADPCLFLCVPRWVSITVPSFMIPSFMFGIDAGMIEISDVIFAAGVRNIAENMAALLLYCGTQRRVM